MKAIIGHIGNVFYASSDPTNNVKAKHWKKLGSYKD